MLTEPAVPVVDLPRADAAQFQFYDHTVGAHLVTADAALARWIDALCSTPPGAHRPDVSFRLCKSGVVQYRIVVGAGRRSVL
jgi:hypothetical protein